MQIIMPMSGTGSRFVRAGYRQLKPLISVEGRPIIEHVVDMFPGEEDFLFICAKDALERTDLRAVLNRIKPTGRVVAIEPHKLGPVHAVLQARDYIQPDQPAVVNYCDFSAAWDYADFKRCMWELQCAGCITAYRGFHPHSLGPNLYAYLRERDGFLLEIQEKHNFTDNRIQEFASAGTYYFRTGALLLRYFQRAIERGLQTNGEFYASSPYNLLVEDGLDVFVYELKRFLQWGTPEDLEEYLNWSRYFTRYENWRPALPAHAGTNLIPMAGAGVRFTQAGYGDPKPLVPVDGRTLVERSLDCLPAAKNWVAVCRSEHLREARLQEALRKQERNVLKVGVAETTAGQACSCLLARDHLDMEAPLLIAPCDAAVVFDEQRYAALTADPRIDCLVWTFRNHPHANRNPQQYGWVRTSDDDRVEQILCKVRPEGKVENAPGIIGTFWFRQARFFLDAADRLIALDRRVRDEFYVDSAIQVLTEQGRRARIFPVTHYICLGTPDDVRTYEYWAQHFRDRRDGRRQGATAG